jgi:hypothetical protein
MKRNMTERLDNLRWLRVASVRVDDDRARAMATSEESEHGRGLVARVRPGGGEAAGMAGKRRIGVHSASAADTATRGGG